MILNFKVAMPLCLSGLIASFFFNYGKSCSYEKTSYFYKSSIDTTESVLDCRDQGRDYSVFLALKEELSSDSSGPTDAISFKVVDNKDQGKVKWGPGSEVGNSWDKWGISITTEDIVGGGETQASLPITSFNYSTAIRVPRTGNSYGRTGFQIACQKSHLQIRTEKEDECNKLWGRKLTSSNMKFELTPEGGIKISKGFDFKDDFKPRRVWCTS